MDERQRKISTYAMERTVLVAYLYGIIGVLYRWFSTWDIWAAKWELGLLGVLTFCVLFFSRQDESLWLPKTMGGKPLPLGLDEASVRLRKKAYRKEGLVLSVVASLFLTLVNWAEMDFAMARAAGLVVPLIIRLVASYVAIYLVLKWINEYAVKQYEKKMEELEEE